MSVRLASTHSRGLANADISSARHASAINSKLSFGFANDTGAYSIVLDGETWYESTASPEVCVNGQRVLLQFVHASFRSTSGSDQTFGKWTGLSANFEHKAGSTSATMVATFKMYSGLPNVAVATASFPFGLRTSRCGRNTDLSTSFPSFRTNAARAPSLHTLSWRGQVLETTASATGLDHLGATGLDCGPIASTDPSSGKTLVWSSLTSHKVLPQRTADGVFSVGLSGSLPSVPAGFEYSYVFVASPSAEELGPTAGLYHWGAHMQRYHNTSRLHSVTLTDVGYYTDDGAYYYVWEAFGIPARPWPAEVGLVEVKRALHASGVPIAYMQLDDWWYEGPFYSFRPPTPSNVKAVVRWEASNSSRLFPNGMRKFSDALGLPLQLYTPFWADAFQSPYPMVESTVFKGTKLVAPNASYDFFADLFDAGKRMTNGRFSTYEIDFLDFNFQGSAAMTEDVHAADRWYGGMANAATERNVTIQYCLPSATDLLVSLPYRSVVQARASTDYVDVEGNAAQLGGSSLLMGAVSIAPSKDTLWTRSPQPPTYSDIKQHGQYDTQPHVALDAVFATLSLGPVGISDGIHQTDVGLISQAFRSATDSTLLRPSRPLSTVDSVFANRSRGLPAADVRATHAAVGHGGSGCGSSGARHASAACIMTTFVSYYLVAWRTLAPVALQPTDLYPRAPSGQRLAVRQHVLSPAGDTQLAGCEDGQPAVPACVQMLPPGALPVLPATGGGLADFSLTAVYAPLRNGAYLLGELTKFVHVSPQRFEGVAVSSGGGGRCGVAVTVKGAAGEKVSIVTVDVNGTVCVAVATVGGAGRSRVDL